LAISGAGVLEILTVRSVIITDVPIVVVLGVGFAALSFPDGAIFI
jgi:hypothetical protein